jgi:hypothetical protein
LRQDQNAPGRGRSRIRLSAHQALHHYAAELTRMLRPTADLNDELAGLDLPAEQVRMWM